MRQRQFKYSIAKQLKKKKSHSSRIRHKKKLLNRHRLNIDPVITTAHSTKGKKTP